MSKINEWTLSVRRRNTAIYLRELYETMAVQLYGQYEPTRTANQRVSRKFLRRLEAWLSCFDNEAQKWAAFKSLQYLLFAGQSEFDELYRHAAENVVKPWLVDQGDVDVFDENVDGIVDGLIQHCWICPATDSLRINGFLHVSHLRGKSVRPDWHSLRQLGSDERIRGFVEKQQIRYLIILEDFSGTGAQLSKAVTYAASVFQGPILVVPLIICAPGHEKMLEGVAKGTWPNVTYVPGLVLSAECLIAKEPVEGQPRLFTVLRTVMKAGYEKIRQDVGRDLNGEEFGYEGTGSLVVLYSNCPNNTPPIFYCETASWHPLFPRSSRV